MAAAASGAPAAAPPGTEPVDLDISPAVKSSSMSSSGGSSCTVAAAAAAAANAGRPAATNQAPRVLAASSSAGGKVSWEAVASIGVSCSFLGSSAMCTVLMLPPEPGQASRQQAV
jgi:hypothetical protein